VGIAGQVTADLRAAWNRQLYRWWHHYNEEFLAHALRVPAIGLGESRTELGRWERAWRRLTISAWHITEDPWLQVMATLRHEMAHQFSDEVLAATGEPPHGPAFRRAAEKLRCLAGPVDGSGFDAGNERVLARLKKVLTLAESPHRHEAEAAVKTARRLLLTYNIDLVALDQERGFGVRYLGEPKGRYAPYELWLAHLLHEFFFVEVVWVETYRPGEDRPGSILQVCGTPGNLEMAAYVHGYLTELLSRLWQEYRRRQQLTGNRERQRFFAGVLQGFCEQLRQQEQVIRAEGALVWAGDSRLVEYCRYLNPRTHTRRGRGVTVSAAYRDGVTEGHRVSIRRPVAASRDGFGGYLRGA
jgi:hypothetical protein